MTLCASRLLLILGLLIASHQCHSPMTQNGIQKSGLRYFLKGLHQSDSPTFLEQKDKVEKRKDNSKAGGAVMEEIGDYIEIIDQCAEIASKLGLVDDILDAQYPYISDDNVVRERLTTGVCQLALILYENFTKLSQLEVPGEDNSVQPVSQRPSVSTEDRGRIESPKEISKVGGSPEVMRAFDRIFDGPLQLG